MSLQNFPDGTSMKGSSGLEIVPALLLVGGLGTRLRSIISSTPKPLAKLGNAPFLELLVQQLREQGIRRLIMCTGYMAEDVQTAFGDGSEYGLSISYSKEAQPLGTAGAVKLAKSMTGEAENVVVLNGDSFVKLDLLHLLALHKQRRAVATLAARRVDDASRYGSLKVDENSRVMAFLEKSSRPEPGIVNAGVYVFSRDIFEHIPDGNSSLEKDVFPNILKYGVYAVEQNGLFIDIGTPDDYHRAQAISDRLYEAALSKDNSEYKQ
jgi:D-glycero-alpha-D-manno-heptose 1-phosphate guanylyltransferase